MKQIKADATYVEIAGLITEIRISLKIVETLAEILSVVKRQNE
jgi:hypothetical protein